MPPALGVQLLVLLLICATACSAADILECGMVTIWNADGFADCEAASAAWSQRARLRRQSFREENRPKILRAHTSWNRTGDAQCSGNGLVVAAGTFLAQCDCFWGWQGDDCSEPLSAAPKGAVVYMAYGEEKYGQYLESALQALNENYANTWPTAVRVFCSANLMPVCSSACASLIGGSCQAVLLQLQTPAALQNMTLDGRAGGATHAVPLNYLHMVRWFSFEWFKHEALSEFDFVWRMDADLWLKFPVPCDIFTVMATSRAAFGLYYYAWSDSRAHIGSSFELASRLSRDVFPASSAHLALLSPGVAYSFPFPPPLAYVAAEFDATGMSHTHRVGEQVFHPLLLALLLPPSSVRQFGGLGPFGHHNGKLIWGVNEMDGGRLLFEDNLCKRDVVCDDTMTCSSAEEFWGECGGAAEDAAP